MIEVKILGAEELRRAARIIRKSGRPEIQKQLLRGLRESTKPVGREVRSDLPHYLPDRYAGVLSKALRFTTQSKTSGWPEVTVTARAKGKVELRHITTLNRGTLRHPLYGDRHHWYAQRVRPGFFDEPANRVLRDVQIEAAKSVERAVANIEKEL